MGRWVLGRMLYVRCQKYNGERSRWVDQNKDAGGADKDATERGKAIAVADPNSIRNRDTDTGRESANKREARKKQLGRRGGLRRRGC